MPFEPQPVLTGELLRLRPLSADDFRDLYAVASDPLVWEQHPASDRWKREVFRRFFDDALACGGALVVLTRDGEVVGSSRYDRLDPDRRRVEIGWTFLARSHWGGRYNGEMKRLMLAHAFRFVRSVVFLVGPENYRSQRAVEKIGGFRDGTRPNAVGRDSVLFRINASDFKQ